MSLTNLIHDQMPDRLAVFDFDGTLCRLNSWHVFLRYILLRGNFASLRIALALLLRVVGISDASVLKRTALSYLNGWTISQLEALGIQIYQQYLRPNLLERGIDELRRCQSEGYRVLVVSGAFDFLLRPFCVEHSIAECLCTQLAYKNDYCLGTLADKEIRGEYKRSYLQKYIGDDSIAWNGSVAYSDELTDLPILGLVKHGFIVGSQVPRSTVLPPGISYGPW